MARRRNAVTHRFARIRGLPPEEKALMQRIGNLIDAALNNRQASNPFEQSQARTNRQIYPPTGLLTQKGTSSVKILWDATPSNELLRYEVEILNLTTGLSETKTTFTNELTYKGATGSYIGRIKSVGRDGSSSQIRQVEFGLGEDIMLIEGAKNGATELGTLVQDNMLLRDGYSVYVWGSCVLDKYMLDTNNEIVFRLWRADTPDASFGEAYLVETISLYPGTESGTNLDPTARAGLISRPAGVRAGSFETSQSVMFSPQRVDPNDDDRTVTFFLQAVNREVEQDEVCLSLVIWSGADGIGTSVPDDPFVPDPPIVFPHWNSFHMNGAPNGEYQGSFPFDTRSWSANIEDGYSIIGNKWTIAMWVRFDNLSVDSLSGAADENNPDAGPQIILSRSQIDLSGNADYEPNAWRFTLDGIDATKSHRLLVDIWDKNAGLAGGIPGAGGTDFRTIEYQGTCFGDRLEKSALFPWGDAQTGIGSGFNDGWYFIVMCFEGGYFTGPIPKFRLYINTATDSLTGEPAMALMVPTGDGSTLPVEQDDSGSLTYQYEQFEDNLNVGKYFSGVHTGDLNQGFVSAGMQRHQLGIWNTALDSSQLGKAANIGPIQSLFNQGRGWAVDWRRNVLTNEGLPTAYLDYLQAENLVHLCQYGAVEQPFRTLNAGRDTGYHLPDWQGALNWTYNREQQGYDWQRDSHVPVGGLDRYHQRELISGEPTDGWYDNLPQSWNRGTDIYDVLSPLGTNNTTQYDFAYPGQNMSGSGTVEQSNIDGLYDQGRYVVGPFSPGYQNDDADRPIKGGTG